MEAEAWVKRPGSLLQDLWPVGVGLEDEAWDVGFPFLLDAGVVVQIELAVDQLPRLGIALGGVALRRGPGAVAAVLRAYLSGSALKAARFSAVEKRPKRGCVRLVSLPGPLRKEGPLGRWRASVTTCIPARRQL